MQRWSFRLLLVLLVLITVGRWCWWYLQTNNDNDDLLLLLSPNTKIKAMVDPGSNDLFDNTTTTTITIVPKRHSDDNEKQKNDNTTINSSQLERTMEGDINDDDIDDDGCGLHAQHDLIQWRTFAHLDASQQSYLQNVHECATRFKWTYVKQRSSSSSSNNNNNNSSQHNDDDSNSTHSNNNNNNNKQKDYYEPIQWLLSCRENISQGTIQSIVSQHEKILFVGDSVLRQQYFVLLCMIDPNLTPQDMAEYSPRDRKRARYEYRRHTPTVMAAAAAAPDNEDSKHNDDNNNHHNNNNKSETNRSSTTTTTTTLRYMPFGYMWHPNERNLYHEAFPHAMRTYTAQDAIVMDSSRHYDTTRPALLEKALRFVIQQHYDQQQMQQQQQQPSSQQQQQQQNSQNSSAVAAVYVMEPTPAEWPTSNGFHVNGCQGICPCEPLTHDRLQGHGAFHVAQDILQRANISLSSIYQQHQLSFTPLMEQLYGTEAVTRWSNHHQSTAAANNHTWCLPDCVPATWRVDITRSLLLLPSSPIIIITTTPPPPPPSPTTSTTTIPTTTTTTTSTSSAMEDEKKKDDAALLLLLQQPQSNASAAAVFNENVVEAPESFQPPQSQQQLQPQPYDDRRVQLVPLFWQLVVPGLVTRQHSSRSNNNNGDMVVGDCTHRSFDALILMNEQLIRSMKENKKKQQHQQQKTTTNEDAKPTPD